MLIGMSACGRSDGFVLSPSSLSTITGITLSVNPPGVGATVSATATVSLSSGSTAVVFAGFTSDTPSVATVTTAGAITGVSIGDVTISVDYQGFKASKKVRVLPNYGGTFYGTYTLDRCTDSGGYAGTNSCASMLPTYPLGSTFQMAFSNTQSSDLTSLTGQFVLGNLLGTSTGVISSAGVLTYAGSISSSATWRMDFRNFLATSPSVGHVGGRFEAVWTDTTQTGSSVWTCTIVDLLRQ